MIGLPVEILAEKAAAIERHLARVEAKLPPEGELLAPSSDASDAVILHLWQAVQIAIDLALAAAVRAGRRAPAGYAAAFRALAEAGIVPVALAERVALAAGFRNRLVHGYEALDMAVVTQAARRGPADLRAFITCLRGAAVDRP
jgi:uncharacterized protein YutE (UPF0331/DUF86 family)